MWLLCWLLSNFRVLQNSREADRHTRHLIHSHLHSELPLIADLYAGNWSKVIRRHQSTLLRTTNTRHSLKHT